MRCRKHPIDLSSTAGVCASCLRERLFAIMTVQAHRKSDAQQPPPLSFPRSVSPYISRRKSDTAATWQIHGQQQRFYSTPQVGSTVQIKNTSSSTSSKKRSGGGIFSSLFFGLFRSKPDSDPVDSCSASSPSWFSTVVLRKKHTRTFSLDERITIGKQQKICGDRDRGMSPARYPDEEDDCGSSGYSSESSQGWKQTPRRTPAAMRRGGGRAAGGASGFAFCLSPLVRASPNRHWNQKGVPPETVVGGESRAPSSKPYLSTTSSFCKNRSRKLADFGRYNSNPNY